jgi:uncharacterized protein HemX
MTNMNSQSTYDQNPMYETSHDQMPGMIAFIALAIVIGAAIALIAAMQQRRKPKTFREKLEHNLSKSSEATGQAFKQLSKDVNDLRRTIEERLEHMR